MIVKHMWFIDRNVLKSFRKLSTPKLKILATAADTFVKNFRSLSNNTIKHGTHCLRTFVPLYAIGLRKV